MQVREFLNTTSTHFEVLQQGSLEIPVVDLSTDSRKVVAGGVFFAIKGLVHDGHAFLSSVIEKRPALIVIENNELPGHFDGTVIKCQNVRKLCAEWASLFFGNPSGQLKMIGVTGTNGKTTCTYLFEHLLTLNGLRTGVIGTIEQRFESGVEASELTTPDTITVQRLLRKWCDLGAQAVVMEVSSIGVEQFRSHAIEFDCGVFTNFTQDHLDYHKTMKAYLDAKKKFLNQVTGGAKSSPFLVFGDSLGEVAKNYQKFVTPAKQIKLEGMTSSGMTLSRGEWKFQVPLVGQYNIENLSVVLDAMERMFSEKIKVDFSQFRGVPGRMQVLPLPRGVAYVDYSHTPDALRSSLEVLKSMAKTNISLVFGCGGDRDREKRPLMGSIAESFADKVYVTSDNPRSESPQKIVEHIVQGMKTSPHAIEMDRKVAIERALAELPAEGLLLIAGKGHEKYQEINGEKRPFDDVQVVKNFIGGEKL